MSEMRKFPIMVGRGTKSPCPSWIPWDAIAPYEGHAKENHQQTLERLAERGGLCPEEAFFVMTGRRWNFPVEFNEALEKEACQFLDKVVRDRGELQAAHDLYRKALFEITNVSRMDHADPALRMATIASDALNAAAKHE